MPTIEYRTDSKMVARMNDVDAVAAVLIAQKYMAQFPSIESAHILTEKTETVVHKATEWQKRNR